MGYNWDYEGYSHHLHHMRTQLLLLLLLLLGAPLDFIWDFICSLVYTIEENKTTKKTAAITKTIKNAICSRGPCLCV